MNERIKELAEQATINIGDEFHPIDFFHKEKFAELIVAETITVLQKRFTGDLNREDMEVRRCIADVQKHFGVEP
jgi:hypothetical protein